MPTNNNKFSTKINIKQTVNGVRPNTIGPLQTNNNSMFSNGGPNLLQTTPNNENSLLSGQNRFAVNKMNK